MDYPENVLREALTNAIVHRDYDRDVSTNIRVFDNRVEIVSYGGLPPNTSIDTFLLGLSITKNKNLADIFYRLELIEAFGTGIPKMIKAYLERGKHIDFQTSPSGFMIVLPNLNYINENGILKFNDPVYFNDSNSLLYLRAKSTIDIIQKKGPVSRPELETIWGIGRSAATKWLDQLIDANILIRVGHGRNTRYTVN